MHKQVTLAKAVEYEGVGLHSGKPVIMKLCPAPEETGIVFKRMDLPGQPSVHARAEKVTSTLRATTLTEGAAQVFTVEHLVAAFSMLGIDNCLIEMNAPEPPVMDGSAAAFSDLILQAGRVEQQAERHVYKVKEAFSVYDGDKYLIILPYDGFRISFTSMNDHPLLGTQFFDVDLDEESFLKEIAPARTIGFMKEIAQMQKMGLGLGGSIDNVVIYDDTKVLSQLRFENELIRHKILDIIGDMYLLGHLQGHIIAVKSGHTLNSQLAKKIQEQRIKEGKAMAIQLDINEIKKILPHRYPMLLVDRILDLEPMKWAIGIKNITANEMQFLGHFPNEPIMPGVLLIEAMAQVGGVAMLYPPENRGKIAVFGKIDKVRFRKQVIPGDQLVTRCDVIKIKGNMGVIHCEGKVDGTVACECDCFFAIQERKADNPI